MDDNLSVALSNSISDKTSSVVSDLLEVGIDALVDNEIIKDIPIVSTALSIYCSGYKSKF